MFGVMPTASSNHLAYVKEWQGTIKKTYELERSGIEGKKKQHDRRSTVLY